MGGGRGSKVTYPSLVHAAKVRHSISVSSFCLDELRLGHFHPNQRIVLLFFSSTPNQPSPSLCPKRVGSFGYSTLASEEKASEK